MSIFPAHGEKKSLRFPDAKFDVRLQYFRGFPKSQVIILIKYLGHT